jgi:hypothetical protein
VKDNAIEKVVHIENDVWLPNIPHFLRKILHLWRIRGFKEPNELRIIKTLPGIIHDGKLPGHVVVQQRGIQESLVLALRAFKHVDLAIEKANSELRIKADIKGTPHDDLLVCATLRTFD